MIDTFIGHIVPVAFNRVPEGWATCDGRLLPVQQYSALFSLIGTSYGGDGYSTFALPDLRGRTLIGQGAGRGLTERALGQRVGQERVALTIGQMPSHNHSLKASSSPGKEVAAPPVVLAASPAGGGAHYGNSGMAPIHEATGIAGGGEAHENRQPFLAIQYLICLEGIYPSRS